MIAVSLPVSAAAGAGIAVVVDRQRQRRTRRRRVGGVDVADRAGAVGVEQRVDLRQRARDGHRLVPLPLTTAPLVPAVTVSVPSVTDSVTVSTAAEASTSLTDSAVLEVQADLLGRAVARRRDRRHRRVVHRRDVDGRRVAAGQRAAGAGVAVVVDRQRQRRSWRVGVSVSSM